LILVLGFLTTWLGVATAHEVRGWRAAMLPLLALLVIVLGSTTVMILLGGASYTADAILHDVGIVIQ